MKIQKKSGSSLFRWGRIRKLLCAGLSMTWLGSCHSYDPHDSKTSGNGPNTIKNHGEYDFVMDAKDQRELLSRVSLLKLGELRGDVLKKLGTPTYDRADITKEGKALGRTVLYYLRILQKGLVNEKQDRLVRLEFDTNDHLTRIIKKVDVPE